jgi:hypothetical protein
MDGLGNAFVVFYFETVLFSTKGKVHMIEIILSFAPQFGVRVPDDLEPEYIPIPRMSFDENSFNLEYWINICINSIIKL